MLALLLCFSFTSELLAPPAVFPIAVKEEYYSGTRTVEAGNLKVEGQLPVTSIQWKIENVQGIWRYLYSFETPIYLDQGPNVGGFNAIVLEIPADIRSLKEARRVIDNVYSSNVGGINGVRAPSTEHGFYGINFIDHRDAFTWKNSLAPKPAVLRFESTRPPVWGNIFISSQVIFTRGKTQNSGLGNRPLPQGPYDQWIPTIGPELLDK